MSMSGFEEQEERGEQSSFPLAMQRSGTPDDFTEEDRLFATELHTFFSPEEENMPPYYIQTLLGADDQRFGPLEPDFACKTIAQVFRRLRLHRRLFSPQVFSWDAFRHKINDMSSRRSTFAMVSGFVFLLLLTVLFTGSSFASGVAILLRGHSGNGVYQVSKYPAGVVHTEPPGQSYSSPSVQQISLLAAQKQMVSPIYSPAYNPPAYVLQQINFYANLDQQWVNGPILEFEYGLRSPAVASEGSGKIWVREFTPKANVLQVVKEGASIPIQVDADGRALAIYVDGRWAHDQWVYGGRSELIYQVNGIVFWIVGDQRDGIEEPQLMQIAQGLVPIHVNQEMRVLEDAVAVTERSEEVPGPFAGDLIVMSPNEGGDGPYYIAVGSQPPHSAR